MAKVEVTGIKTSESLDGYTELYMIVTTDAANVYEWFDVAVCIDVQAYADSKIAEYLSAIAALEAAWDAVGGNFPSTDIDGQPTVIFIPKKSYVTANNNKMSTVITYENNIRKSIKKLGTNEFLPNADRDALRDFYNTALINLRDIQTAATALQTAPLDTNAKVISALRQVGEATGQLAEGLEKLLKGLKRLFE